MLYPQTNRCRTVIPLCGFWEIKIDKENKGISENWFKGFEADTQIGVPGSWNEQLSELGLMDYTGKMWYQCWSTLPDEVDEKVYYLRFGSADMQATVWVNGQKAGQHLGGFLPFEFEISQFLDSSHSLHIVVCIDNTLNHDTIPQGLTEDDFTDFKREREQTYPSTVFDFLAYGGLNRPVKINLLPLHHVQTIKTDTSIHGTTGRISYEAEYNSIPAESVVELKIYEKEKLILTEIIKTELPVIKGSIDIPNCKFWSPENPGLYKIGFALKRNGVLIDEYLLETGVREIKISGDKLLLNGKPVFLKGFGKHEDFPVLGKGLSFPLIIKDFQLMKWIGANSFRTSHYPYSEEIMQMADRMGFMVIDEVPAVSLNFRYVNGKTMINHKNVLKELIDRDRHHPSVICWSIANEPGIWGEPEAVSKQADTYWAEIYKYTKNLDPGRPITLPTCNRWGEDDLGFKYSDFLAINRYWGWYEVPADIPKAGEVLKKELLNLYYRYHKPIMVTEFGADTLEGAHETYPQMFTEEYQKLLVHKYFEVIESLPFMIGEHIWNFADFKTAQNHRRVILNKKGIFNRQRQPKGAAFSIREHWQSMDL